jgi:ATP-dependent DNA ligase
MAFGRWLPWTGRAGGCAAASGPSARSAIAGTLVERELVAFDAESRPDLARLLCRHGLAGEWKIKPARRCCPVQYVLFDLLYYHRLQDFRGMLQGRCGIGSGRVRQPITPPCPKALPR